MEDGRQDRWRESSGVEGSGIEQKAAGGGTFKPNVHPAASRRNLFPASNLRSFPSSEIRGRVSPGAAIGQLWQSCATLSCIHVHIWKLAFREDGSATCDGEDAHEARQVHERSLMKKGNTREFLETIVSQDAYVHYQNRFFLLC